MTGRDVLKVAAACALRCAAVAVVRSVGSSGAADRRGLVGTSRGSGPSACC
ncbi:hypothetical protein [Nocardioides sp. L-11A]|uniref:hypothetical protein n=1 Tax=Nocardioides sp. L-11A TaxID=3043848 RepID=UPI00249B3C52|nr:hypothetical protein QJ852_26280 [Nocardioides sp. L-11A]